MPRGETTLFKKMMAAENILQKQIVILPKNNANDNAHTMNKAVKVLVFQQNSLFFS